MPSILVATGFVRIDADTAPAQKTIKAFGALGASALSTAIGPAAAAASAAVGAVAASFSVATGAAAVYGAAVKAQFSQISEASQKQTTAEDAKAKATTQTAIAQKLAKENGYKYGEAVKITSKMTENARRNAEDYNAALSASKSSTRAAREAQQAYKAKLAELPPETRKTAEALQNLKDSTTSWSDALSGSTMPVFTRGIKFLESLLPKLTPIVRSVADEVNNWVGTLGQGTAGRVFREFGENVTKNGAGALRTFLDIARNLTAGVVGLFNAFMPMSDGVTGGLEKMTARFAEWSANLGSSEGFKTFTDLAKDAGPKLAHTLGVVAEALGDVVSAAGPMAGIGLTLLEVFAGIVDSIPTPVLKLLIPTILAVNAGLKLYAIYTAAATAYQWLFTTSVTVGSGAMYASRAALFATVAGFVAHRIATLASAAATAVWTAASYAFAVAQLAVVAAIRGVTIAVRLLGVGLRFLFANPIGLAILALVALGVALWQLWKRSETFRDIVKGALNAVKTAAVAVGNWFAGPFVQFFVTAWSKIKKWVIDPIVWFFTEGIPAAARVLMQVTLGWINGLVAGAKAAWGTFKRLVIDPQVKFFGETIPNAAKFMRDKVVGWWNSLKDGASAAWGAFKRVVINPVVNYFTVEIPNKARFLRDRVVGWWRSLREGAQGAYNGMRDRIFSPIGRFFKDTIPGWARTMKDKVTGFFRDMRDAIGRVWNGVKDKVKSPVNWVLDRVWNRGIYSIWDKITGWIGIKNTLGKVKMLARGGTVGNEPVGIFNRPTAIVGEGRSAYPEFVIPTDPRYRGRAQKLWEAAGYQLMADGGIIGKIGGWLGNAASAVGSASKGALDFLSNPVSKAKSMLLKVLDGTGALGNSPWVKMITQLPQKAIDGLLRAVKKIGSSLLSGIGLGPSAGSGVKRWTAVVQTALRHVGQSLAYTNITLRRMQQESGGNPNIVNKWDSNWKAGHPSVGLMQVIGPTFRAYAGKMRNVGPFLYGVSVNPLANVYSSMRYALSRYGSLPSAYNRKGGYRNGTAGTTTGMHLFGEAGPELGFSPAGWRILNARRTAGLAGSSTVIERLVLENHGVIGSRHEVENWLVESLTDLKRKGRLP